MNMTNIKEARLHVRVTEKELDQYNTMAQLKKQFISQLIRQTMEKEIKNSLTKDSNFDDVSTWKLKESKPSLTMELGTLNFDKDKAKELFIKYAIKEDEETNEERKYFYRIIAEFSYQLSKLK